MRVSETRAWAVLNSKGEIVLVKFNECNARYHASQAQCRVIEVRIVPVEAKDA